MMTAPAPPYEPRLAVLCDDPECCPAGCVRAVCRICKKDWPCPDYVAAHTEAQVARQQRWADRQPCGDW